MENQNRLFYSYSSYLKEKYGTSAYRVAVDAGFSCPNRNSDKTGGCTYCDELGAMAVYQRGQEADLAHSGNSPSIDEIENLPLKSLYPAPDIESRKNRIKEQVENSIKFLKRRYNPEYLLLYFQAFSNTFAPVSELKEIYDYSLSLANFKELIVSTRPDCLSKANISLLSSYEQKGVDVWVELGLQSSNNISLNRINRGHSRDDFLRAYKLLKENGIKTTVHLIFGLPGEGHSEIMSSISFLAKLKPEGVKIHNLHIPIGTEMFSEYLMGELTVPSGLRHLEYTIEAIERMPRSTVIHRLTCDTPSHRLGAPRTFFRKGSFYSLLTREM
ncbi:MAG: TIGR01212 family radical SAM protein, partial [Spirochaetales bacterium]|nr:TIGR01212 family radical SAM protein [Spirochaetales bacterium]